MDDFDGYAVVERRADGSHRMVTWGPSRQTAWARHVRQEPRAPLSRLASINRRRAVRCSSALGLAARQAVDVGTIEVTVSADGVADLAAPPVVAPPPPASTAALRAPVPRPRALAVLLVGMVAGGCAAGAGRDGHRGGAEAGCGREAAGRDLGAGMAGRAVGHARGGEGGER